MFGSKKTQFKEYYGRLLHAGSKAVTFQLLSIIYLKLLTLSFVSNTLSFGS